MIECTFLEIVCFAPFKGIQDCLEFLIPCHGFRDTVLDCGFFVSETWISDSDPLVKVRIPFFPEEKFPDSLTWGDMLIQTYITRGVLLGRPNFMITLYDY